MTSRPYRSRSVTATYMVRGLGFDARLRIPVTARALEAMQYPIGDTANWERIVANLGVLVDELDEHLVAIGRGRPFETPGHVTGDDEVADGLEERRFDRAADG